MAKHRRVRCYVTEDTTEGPVRFLSKKNHCVHCHLGHWMREHACCCIHGEEYAEWLRRQIIKEHGEGEIPQSSH